MRSYAPASGPKNSENPSGCSYLKNLNLLLRWPHEALLAFEQITFSPTVSFMFVSFFRLLSSLIDSGLLSPYFFALPDGARSQIYLSIDQVTSNSALSN